MQHITSPTLSWSAARQVYELSEGKPGESLHLTSEGPAWFAWLDSVPSFAFHGQSGSLRVLQSALVYLLGNHMARGNGSSSRAIASNFSSVL